jgi:hypothetical protein
MALLRAGGMAAVFLFSAVVAFANAKSTTFNASVDEVFKAAQKAEPSFREILHLNRMKIKVLQALSHKSGHVAVFPHLPAKHSVHLVQEPSLENDEVFGSLF